ncbi:hypothetical protein CASFOL_038676 [Castilleja foliolosa]|uniref:Epidermal patterning factor-like protein n=1 Tax=Castilleja foliolosa TaxID=1961234 RepID=A0ABD3BNT0_9LAMI
MALSRNYHLSLCFSVIAILLFSLTSAILKDEKMILGSRPPGCVNKCLNCRPCRATLVIPPHTKLIINNNNFVKKSSSHDDEYDDDDDTYYLLSWKCRCGNKLYKP